MDTPIHLQDAYCSSRPPDLNLGGLGFPDIHPEAREALNLSILNAKPKPRRWPPFGTPEFDEAWKRELINISLRVYTRHLQQPNTLQSPNFQTG